jgi:hypothetical protein
MNLKARPDEGDQVRPKPLDDLSNLWSAPRQDLDARLGLGLDLAEQGQTDCLGRSPSVGVEHDLPKGRGRPRQGHFEEAETRNGTDADPWSVRGEGVLCGGRQRRPVVPLAGQINDYKAAQTFQTEQTRRCAQGLAIDPGQGSPPVGNRTGHGGGGDVYVDRGQGLGRLDEEAGPRRQAMLDVERLLLGLVGRPASRRSPFDGLARRKAAQALQEIRRGLQEAQPPLVAAKGANQGPLAGARRPADQEPNQAALCKIRSAGRSPQDAVGRLAKINKGDARRSIDATDPPRDEIPNAKPCALPVSFNEEPLGSIVQKDHPAPFAWRRVEQKTPPVHDRR